MPVFYFLKIVYITEISDVKNKGNIFENQIFFYIYLKADYSKLHSSGIITGVLVRLVVLGKSDARLMVCNSVNKFPEG